MGIHLEDVTMPRAYRTDETGINLEKRLFLYGQNSARTAAKPTTADINT